MISGAVFTDSFISQPFTDYMFFEGTPYLNDCVYNIAEILRVLRTCLLDLLRVLCRTSSTNPLLSIWVAGLGA
jgi:hypothetical protein